MLWNVRQVTGDGSAATDGAVFGGWLDPHPEGECERYRLVLIRPIHEFMCSHPDWPPIYYAWCADYARTMLASDVAAEAVQALNMDIGEEPSTERREALTFEALFIEGYLVYTEEPGSSQIPWEDPHGWPTLRAAMDDLHIPREALWEPGQYDLDANGTSLGTSLPPVMKEP